MCCASIVLRLMKQRIPSCRVQGLPAGCVAFPSGHALVAGDTELSGRDGVRIKCTAQGNVMQGNHKGRRIPIGLSSHRGPLFTSVPGLVAAFAAVIGAVSALGSRCSAGSG